MELSILIPARNEMFLGRTVRDILDHLHGDTEVIVVLDGAWPAEPLQQDPRLTVAYLPESIGQRAATNLACRLARGKYVMKVDAHCSFDEGFDVKMCRAMDGHDDWTMVPLMKNLHAFDWVCPDGHRRYQGRSGPCIYRESNHGEPVGPPCGKPTEMDVVWRAKPSPNSTAFRFDKTLHFQYWADYKRRQKDEVSDTLSIQGSCFMLTREKYWELDICDEQFGSWGQQGVEVACKTWLSGGRVVCNQGTWYAHMFRTQGGDFGFPYPLSGEAVNHARKYSRELFLEDKWPKAKRTFDSLLQQFYPVPDWHDEQVKDRSNTGNNVTKGIIYYTDNRAPLKVSRKAQKLLLSSGLPITSCSIKPMPHFGRNVHLPGERGPLQMFRQILAALEASTADIVFFCEADVLYHKSHFDFTPPKKDVWYYNTNVYKLEASTGKAWRVDDCRQVSGIAVYRELALAHYRERVRRVEKEGFSMAMGYEPGTHGRPERVDDAKSDTWESAAPNIDIRHGNNFTRSKTSPDEFRNKKYAEGWTEVSDVPGWGIISLWLPPRI